MRETVNFNAGWQFVSGKDGNVTEVTLPHSYNGSTDRMAGMTITAGSASTGKPF